MNTFSNLFLVGFGALLFTCPTFGGSTFERVRAAGQLSCGIIATPEDWNKTDLHGPLTALDAEICKAIAVAVLGTKSKLDLKAFDSELQAEQALSQGVVDLAVGLTPDSTSMWHWKIAFGAPIFFDGQGVLVRGDSAVRSISELTGLKVCVVEGTDNEKVLLRSEEH